MCLILTTTSLIQVVHQNGLNTVTVATQNPLVVDVIVALVSILNVTFVAVHPLVADAITLQPLP